MQLQADFFSVYYRFVRILQDLRIPIYHPGVSAMTWPLWIEVLTQSVKRLGTARMDRYNIS